MQWSRGEKKEKKLGEKVGGPVSFLRGRGRVFNSTRLGIVPSSFRGTEQGSLMDPEEFRSNFGGRFDLLLARGGGGGGGGTNFRKSSVKRSLTRDDLSRKCEFTLEFRKRK